MKPNETQLAAIQTCIDCLECLRLTNDITSPSHIVDAELEVDKLELPTGEEVLFAAHLVEVMIMIQRMK